MIDFQISGPETMEKAIREVGIIPFFKNVIPGYSIQELTMPGCWFGGEEDTLGPWDWKIDCILSGDIAYGKFLCGGKASFATIPFYRELMNVRRAKTVPDENGSRIMSQLDVQGSITIKEIRALLNVKKSAADAAMSKLQHQCRVVTGVIERVYNGPEHTYKGWQVSTFCTPESLFEPDVSWNPPAGLTDVENTRSLITTHTPEESLEFLVDHVSRLFPGEVTRKQILKALK